MIAAVAVLTVVVVSCVAAPSPDLVDRYHRFFRVTKSGQCVHFDKYWISAPPGTTISYFWDGAETDITIVLRDGTIPPTKQREVGYSRVTVQDCRRA